MTLNFTGHSEHQETRSDFDDGRVSWFKEFALVKDSEFPQINLQIVTDFNPGADPEGDDCSNIWPWTHVEEAKQALSELV
jgi:hypothetical protein